MSWIARLLRQHHDTTELDHRVAEAETIRAEAAEVRTRAERTGADSARLLRENHLSERLHAEWARTWKGRPA